MDTRNLINVPFYIDLLFFLIGFIISGITLHLYVGKDWIKEFKSAAYFIIALVMTAFPLSVLLLAVFKVSIIYYNHKQGDIFKEKCLVENVSTGKYRSLSYRFRDKIYDTKSFNYLDYSKCNHDCYVELTLEKKPFGMYYILNIKKTELNQH
ncbi:hypothetical protein [Flavobacterium terrae]|uniref:Uncharacterized protein n=1 Tax=Flavobacterium terrae TaxID=415425 RepID=A0A1M6HB22_9FLAO|nr:hypothetical protein [Flavobacterium terrae]SHJ19417.1 hypothetical protein SAMN05444363_2945 [Flavobacterium terrae]